MIHLEKKEMLFEWHKKVMCKKMNDEIKKILDDGYIKIDKKRKKIYSPERTLLEYVQSHIESFITADIEMQKNLINEMKAYNAVLPRRYRKDDKKYFSYKVIRHLFEVRGYDEFTKGIKDGDTGEYGAYEFVSLINLKTCPYCNRNYISVIDKKYEHQKKTRPELDHFYPKSKYPFLAVNYYNLIPSCSTCNKLKSDDHSVHLINPYDEMIKKVKFTYWLNDMKFYNVSSLKEISYESEKSITIEIDNIPLVHNYIFQLDNLYQGHRDIVIELILKYLHYPESYINELSTFGYSPEEIYRFIFSNYYNDEDLSKRPLSKLIKDIATELELLDFIQD